jgi:DNA polymerase III subunit gamma/tau
MVYETESEKPMSYVALYRAYRPKSFDEVAGQKVIIKTLKNALLHSKIAHAYLFSGPRGTGKTSVAKIFAKAVNCLNQPNENPCNTCDVCLGIDRGNIPDVIEIDAASNNGVEEIRELRDRVKYMPSVGKFKVYIVDEVHMLSTAAFNALLKTLEEPPKHVIFILATTEVHKIPATILSRCQRFDFKNIETDEIISKLKEIIAQEGIQIDADAIHAIAQNAEGGLRDAISLLDQTVSFSGKTITADDVHQVFGSVSKSALKEILLSISNKETSKAMTQLKELLSAGKDISRIVSDLILALRDILIEKTTDVETSFYEDLSSVLSLDKIYVYLDILNALQQDIKWTHQKRAYVELAIVKMIEHKRIQTVDNKAAIDDLRATIEALEKKLNQAPVRVDRPKTGTPLVTVKDVQNILNDSDKDKKSLLISGWPHLETYPKDHLKMTAYLLFQGELEAVSSNQMLLVYDSLEQCRRIMEPEVKKQVLEILNAKTEFIKDYVAILRTDWLVIKETYVTLWKKGQKKPILPPYDLKLYEKETPEEEDPEIVAMAKSFFGDKITIKEK